MNPLSGNALKRKANDAITNRTEYPAPGEIRSAQSITGPNKPANAAEPAVLRLASPKNCAERSFGTRSASNAQLPPAKAAEPSDIRAPKSRIWLALSAQTSINALKALKTAPTTISGTRPMRSASQPVSGDARMLMRASPASKLPACSAAWPSESPSRVATKNSKKRPVP